MPNFSEGRNKLVIDAIVEAIRNGGKNADCAEPGVKVLDVDPGEATNRTVVTFAGSPEAVMEAAFEGVRKAGELIDMRHHHGAHPRSGATDVLPLIPISGITLEECALLARQLAERIFRELGIACYCYEAAAYTPERKNLAVCRSGEYEALPQKIADEKLKPDFGPAEYNDTIARSGAINVGARDFLIAVNFNLNTTSTALANEVAFDVRERGRAKRENGKIVKDAEGKSVMIPGTLKGCKAIGWYIDEYGIAQVSMNITDINATPLHKAFDEVCRAAQARGLRVSGTEIIGLLPKRSLIEAGKYFLEKQQRSTGIPEAEIMKIAIKSMGLEDLRAFDVREKVIEFLIEDEEEKARKERLVRMSCKAFAEETSSESPAPGGGSISAYMGALGAALACMVANLSAGKRGWESRWKEFSDWAEEAQQLMKELLALVDEDTAAFNSLMGAMRMPKSSPEQIEERDAAIEAATLYAGEVPLRTMKTAVKAFPLLRRMAEEGNPNSVSDAGVGALAARSAVLGAQLNVKINASGLQNRDDASRLLAEAEAVAADAIKAEEDILNIVNGKID